jgi:FKBP-type peptidyl-prolyl cis-trans isomerase SlyD
MRTEKGSAKLPFFVGGLSAMAEERVEKHKIVDVTYTITDEKGEVLEAVEIPVSYLHGGESGLFEEVEAALEGKAVGEVVQVTLPPERGFGEWNPSMTYTDAIENVPPEYHRVGAKAEFTNEKGESMEMVVTHVDQGTVTLDGNHPFAGKTVTFNVKVAAVRDATPEEIRQGGANPATPTTLH